MGHGKVVVDVSISLDGFSAAPDAVEYWWTDR